MPSPLNLYDVARQLCHKYGMDWTDPRTGVTHPPPPSILCPKCLKRSFNLEDVNHSYCGFCHEFHDGKEV
jgi:ribosomal protein L37E